MKTIVGYIVGFVGGFALLAGVFWSIQYLTHPDDPPAEVRMPRVYSPDAGVSVRWSPSVCTTTSTWAPPVPRELTEDALRRCDNACSRTGVNMVSTSSCMCNPERRPDPPVTAEIITACGATCKPNVVAQVTGDRCFCDSQAYMDAMKCIHNKAAPGCAPERVTP